MNEENLVNFEQAKWLAYIEYNEPCLNKFTVVDGKIYEGSMGNSMGGGIETYRRPFQWEVVEWLRLNHGIWITVGYLGDGYNCTIQNKEGWTKKAMGNFNSPQEAYSAAFDHIKEKLIQKK